MTKISTLQSNKEEKEKLQILCGNTMIIVSSKNIEIYAPSQIGETPELLELIPLRTIRTVQLIEDGVKIYYRIPVEEYVYRKKENSSLNLMMRKNYTV